jgi:hypothetical protein
MVSVPAKDHRTQRTFCSNTHESIPIHYRSLWKQYPWIYRCMDNVQPQIRSFLNGADPCLAYSNCGTSTYGKTWRDTDMTVGSLWIRSHPFLTWFSCGTTTYSKTWWDTGVTWVPIRIGPIHLSQDFPVVPPCMAKRDELVWLCKK